VSSVRRCGKKGKDPNAGSEVNSKDSLIKINELKLIYQLGTEKVKKTAETYQYWTMTKGNNPTKNNTTQANYKPKHETINRSIKTHENNN